MIAMKLAMIGFELGAVLLLLSMLRRAGLPAARVLIYALHPLPAWEFAGSGHVDAAMIGLTVLALWLHQRGGRWSTGIALAAASLVKPFPLALAPALYRRWDWRMPAAFVATVALAYAPYLSVGAQVLGFLPSYVQEEGLQSGAAFYPLWLLRALLPIGVPTASISRPRRWRSPPWRCLCCGHRPEAGDGGAAWRQMMMLAAALMFAVSPHFAWYLAWLLPLACLAPWLPALYLVSSSFLLYLPAEFALVGSLTYGLFAILVLTDRWRPAALPIREKRDVVGAHADKPLDPRRYFEQIGADRDVVAATEPVCLYLEVTNRCNLLCTTCPRTFEDLEPPADLSWDLFTKIVDQLPNIARVVLHGVGEPRMVRELPRMIAYLKARGTYVLFNTNGTLLSERKGRELNRCRARRAAGVARRRRAGSLQAGARPGHVRPHRAQGPRLHDPAGQARRRARPRVSLWLTGLRETLDQLPDFVSLAHDMGVKEVYLQRLVFLPDAQGLARPESALFEQLDRDQSAILEAAQARADQPASRSTPRARPSRAPAWRATATTSPGRCAGGPGR
ncbi:MAG: radical SAM protein [Pseudomonadota bacterium]